MPFRIIATPVKLTELQPGDLFSTYGPFFWATVNAATGPTDPMSEQVYVRTAAAGPVNDGGLAIYQLTIERDGAAS